VRGVPPDPGAHGRVRPLTTDPRPGPAGSGGPDRSNGPDLGPPTTLVLIRHARTPDTGVRVRGSGPRSEPRAPQQDPELDDAGWEQARRLGRWVAREWPGAVVVSSPARRARGTASAIDEALGRVREAGDGRGPEGEDGWAEVGLGEWDGRSYAEIAAGWPREYRAWRESPAAAPPGGESLVQVGHRVAAARDRLLTAHPGTVVVVVTHTGPVRALLGLALEAGPAAFWRLRIDPASVSVVRFWADGGCEVAGVNSTGHLR
jgi:ribonuclease H / adenosylcobalamin/alpha-ribazole phosphatase